MKTRLFYVHGQGVDPYMVKDAQVVPQDVLPGADNRISIIDSLFCRNILVISKELLHYRRERYPPTSAKNLSGIIANDVTDLFPMLNAPDFHYRVFESQRGYSVVDIWAWPSQLIRGHAQALRCNYVIPEDALFTSVEPEVTIYTHALFDYAVAHDSRGFIGSRTFVHPLRQTDIDLFLHGLGGFRQDVRRINSYLEQKAPYPPSLIQTTRINIKPFKTTKQHSLTEVTLLYRLASYAVIGYVAWAWFSIRQIDGTITLMEDKIKKVDNQVNFLANLKSKDETTKIADELQKRIAHVPTPVDCLDVLAGVLSDGTYVNQLNITYGGIEAALTSPDPAGTIKALNASRSVQSVQLKGEPQKDAQDYRFRLSIGIRAPAPSVEASNTGVSTPKQ
ncbi:MAG: hypothetical protein HQL03_02840 [Nitrospirae bacterium]|nr:hypothetical protein [Nitrospirota bacterium]MBF0590875.1 hypothetical protein [Nitrospirota bacterium]